MSPSNHFAPDHGPGGSGAPLPGTRFYRFLRYSHILSSTLREILEEKFLREVSPHRLTSAQFCFLKLIAMNADLQVGEVARRLGVSAAASSKNIDKLQRLGLVVRNDAPGDRRATLLTASVEGRRLVRDYERLKASYIMPVIHGLGPERLDQLCDLLERVCVGLVEEEQPVGEKCLRCAGYYEENCSVGLIQGECAFEERRAAGTGGRRSSEES